MLALHFILVFKTGCTKVQRNNKVPAHHAKKTQKNMSVKRNHSASVAKLKSSENKSAAT